MKKLKRKMKNDKEKLKKVLAVGFLAIAFFVFAGATLTVFAAETTPTPTPTVNVLEGVSYTPLVSLPLGKGGAELSSWTLSTYLSGMLRLIIALGGAIAVLMAIIGGVQYVASGIAPSAKNDAKARITSAFIGLGIILTSYLLLNTISPDLVNFELSLPKIKGTSRAAPKKPNQEIPSYMALSVQVSNLCTPACKPEEICTTFTNEFGEESLPSCGPSRNAACGSDLSPISTDSDVVLMENRVKIVWESPNSDVQRNLNKLKQELGEFTKYISEKNGTVTVNSAYRPLAYQAHLYEVFKRWNEIKDNVNPDCATLKEKIRREFQKHELGGSVSSPSGCAPHVKGTGIDLTVSGITFFPNNSELTSKGIDLFWQDADGDPWHYNLVNPPFSGCVN